VIKPTHVVFRGVQHSDEVEAHCIAEAQKLEQFYDRITGCRIIVARPHRRHRGGNLYGVRIDLTVPGGEIVVDREPPVHHQNEELSSAIRDAFDRARRRLEDFVRRRRERERLGDASA